MQGLPVVLEPRAQVLWKNIPFADFRSTALRWGLSYSYSEPRTVLCFRGLPQAAWTRNAPCDVCISSILFFFRLSVLGKFPASGLYCGSRKHCCKCGYEVHRGGSQWCARFLLRQWSRSNREAPSCCVAFISHIAHWLHGHQGNSLRLFVRSVKRQRGLRDEKKHRVRLQCRLSQQHSNHPMTLHEKRFRWSPLFEIFVSQCMVSNVKYTCLVWVLFRIEVLFWLELLHKRPLLLPLTHVSLQVLLHLRLLHTLLRQPTVHWCRFCLSHHCCPLILLFRPRLSSQRCHLMLPRSF